MDAAVRLTVVCVAVGGLVITGCSGGGTAGGLDSSCGEFLKKTQQEQLHIASEWGRPARDGKTDQMSDFVAPTYRGRLINYCGQSGHSGQKIRSLEFRFTG